MMKVTKALISVSDKTDVAEFAAGLSELGVEMVSTGGTARALRDAGLKIREVSELTGSPEILGGRVKTLHPKIHGAILSQPHKAAHVATLERESIEPINMVVVNLYRFEKAVSKPDITLDEALEKIDIGGVALLRAGSKNFENVAVVSSPEQYAMVLEQMRENQGGIPTEVLRTLAVEAFARTRDYDTAIHGYLSGSHEAGGAFPPVLTISYGKIQDLRYGENPHQRAAFYAGRAKTGEPSIVNAEQLSGKELSYNNIVDVDAALAIVREYESPACAVMKHATPCGVATATSLAKAYEDAHACDPVSAFGSIVALNRAVDMETATSLHETRFIECTVAPGYDREALELMVKKKNRRILRVTFPDPEHYYPQPGYLMRTISGGGLLVQDLDTEYADQSDFRVATKRQPTADELASLLFAWRVTKHVRSNAIVLAKGTRTVGIGAGQMSRVDASTISVWKAGDRAKGSVMASDAFFPMRDAVDAAAEAGVSAIIQPGGSKGDEEVIAAADERDIAMVMTGRRHFKHC